MSIKKKLKRENFQNYTNFMDCFIIDLKVEMFLSKSGCMLQHFKHHLTQKLAERKVDPPLNMRNASLIF